MNKSSLVPAQEFLPWIQEDYIDDYVSEYNKNGNKTPNIALFSQKVKSGFILR